MSELDPRDWNTQLVDHLVRLGLLVDRSDPSRVVVRHAGALAAAVELDTKQVLERAAEATYSRGWLASFAEGVAAGLDAATCDAETFADAAGQLVPRLAATAFLAGIGAVDGAEPFTKPWVGDLVVVYWIARDEGDLLLRRAEVQRWGVTDDRVTSAARSLLYHKSRGGPQGLGDGVDAYAVGDGYDAARVLVIEDLEWSRSRRGLWIGVPSNAMLLFREPTDEPGALERFRATARARCEAAAAPLWPGVFVIEAGKLAVL